MGHMDRIFVVFLRGSWEDRLSETEPKATSRFLLLSNLDLGEPQFTCQENWTTAFHPTDRLWPWTCC